VLGAARTEEPPEMNGCSPTAFGEIIRAAYGGLGCHAGSDRAASSAN